MRRRAGTVVVLLVLAGCQGRISPPAPEQRVGAITLMSGYSAVSTDDDPAADGVTLELYFHRPGSGEPVPVAGALEVVMYEGVIRAQDLDAAEPYHVWRLEGEQLQSFLIRRAGQWGYRMMLRWGDQPPGSDSITLLARYRPEGGPVVTSAPTHISMGRS